MNRVMSILSTSILLKGPLCPSTLVSNVDDLSLFGQVSRSTRYLMGPLYLVKVRQRFQDPCRVPLSDINKEITGKGGYRSPT